ncbi:MAG: TIGR04211 family SH3 domain-containing protein [gamma proteobacterium symbiont of Bathyaustriella thionipta]|nr:TIGR04211 family SH3 domain-containing protein [gamma proteobacterium symbiont of Bathyaustriella thionipta]
MNRQRAFWVLLLWLAMLTPLNAAYITDKLVAGLYAEADKSSAPIAALASGTPMEVLERKQGFTKVRLTNGDIGWVESGFVTREKPARVMLLENQSEMAGLKKQIRQKDADLQAMQSSTPAADEEITQLKKQLADAQQKLAILGEIRTEPFSGDSALGKAEEQIEELQALLAETNSASMDQDGLADENRLLRQRLSAAAELLDLSDLSPENPQTVESAIFSLSITQWLFMAAAGVLGLLLGIIIISLGRRKNIAGYRI